MSFVALIPARLKSTRLPNKPLADIHGQPMIVRVAERAKQSGASRVVIAADDASIVAAVAAVGLEVVLTRVDHQSGTERLAEAADLLGLEDHEVVVNVQGDEPLMDPDLIDTAVERFSAIPDFKFGSAMTPMETEEDIQNPNVVKVVVGQRGQALYFTRFPAPYRRKLTTVPVYQHIGFYVYSREFVIEFSKMSPTPLEQTECLEQLRALENGVRIDMIETKYRGIGVDAPEDVARIEWELKRISG